VLSALALAGCSAPPDGDSGTQGAPNTSSGTVAKYDGPTGNLGVALTLPNGSQVASVTWVIAGPDGAATVVTSGAIDVHESGGTQFVVALPPASGYHVALSAVSSDMSVTCGGSADFGITARKTTAVSVQMGCNTGAAGGHSTLVTGESFDCAAWDSVTANPVSIEVGSSSSLVASATGPNQGAVTYAWSAPSGGFSSPSLATTQFTCTQPGIVPVTLVVGDGPVPQGSTCNPKLDTDTIQVTCTDATAAAPAVPAWMLAALATGLAFAGSQLVRRRLPAA
jgi:hypothetical protein